jgi:hypothetical protein
MKKVDLMGLYELFANGPLWVGDDLVEVEYFKVLPGGRTLMKLVGVDVGMFGRPVMFGLIPGLIFRDTDGNEYQYIKK